MKKTKRRKRENVRKVVEIYNGVYRNTFIIGRKTFEQRAGINERTGHV